MRAHLIVALALFPVSALAVGSQDDTPPAPSETTTTCTEGLVFDLATETCLPPEQSTNPEQAMLDDIRELAYFGRYADAQSVLRLMPDQSDPWVLTYMGFTTRKMGDLDGGMSYYAAALEADPDYFLARSYKGQAHAEAGDLVLASAELSEIRRRGGRGTWAEVSLRMAIDTGQGFTY
ncbi:tetratricopeptide repeat protein [Roseisalinus antarcticus]|uniref:Tetratricopeptide repeat protein n=1 Tax=Roseisalinus antarcticus TaxID=254357 RepID=A0A1Y5TTU8_9RHOB|nr:hypothetical protein [Roseisalinus antarcticus]SLN72490.1 hypothetical protein ROA7023_03612 [Roseisalinus antarcticus]